MADKGTILQQTKVKPGQRKAIKKLSAGRKALWKALQ